VFRTGGKERRERPIDYWDVETTPVGKQTEKQGGIRRCVYVPEGTSEEEPPLPWTADDASLGGWGTLLTAYLRGKLDGGKRSPALRVSTLGWGPRVEGAGDFYSSHTIPRYKRGGFDPQKFSLLVEKASGVYIGGLSHPFPERIQRPPA